MKLVNVIAPLFPMRKHRLFTFALALSLALGGIRFARADDTPPTVQKLIEQLHSDDKQTRRDAVEELGNRGEAAREAVPELIRLIDDPDQQIPINAFAALGKIGPAAKDAIPALIDAMENKKMRGGRSNMRIQSVMRVAQALSGIGPAAIPALQTALGSQDPQQRTGAARALGGMGPAAAETVPALIKNLADSSDPARQESIEALAQIGAPAKAAVVAALADPDAKRRAGSALALSELGSAAKGEAPALIDILEKEKDPAARAAQLAALPKTGPEPARAVPLLVAAVTDQDEAIRHAGINALAGARSLHHDAVKSLAGLLKSGDTATRQHAAHALGRLGPSSADALPALMTAASTANGDDAFSDAIAQVGTAAMPVLLSALKDAKPANTDWIFHTLRGFGAAAVPTLTEAMQSLKPEIQIAAIRALGGMGLDATSSIHTLFVLASSSNPKVQAAALQALIALHADPAQLKPILETAMASPVTELKKAAIAGTAATGGASALGVDSLMALLSDDDAAGRLIAVHALGELGPKAAPAVTALIQHLGEPALQLDIIETLRRLGPAAAPAVPQLLELAKKNNGDQRPTILPALAAIGREASAALPMIRAAAKDPTREIRVAAVPALVACDPDESEVLSTLLVLLKDESGGVRRAVAPELAKFGAKAAAGVPSLISMLDRENDRFIALGALKSIGVHDVPDLLKLLAMKEPKIRVFACDSLGALGPAAKDAAPRLRDLLSSASPVQEAAKKALARIEVPAS